MKTVAILHKDSPDIATFPDNYAPRYASLYSQGAARGLAFCEASAYDFDPVSGLFSRARLPDGRELANFRPDAVCTKIPAPAISCWKSTVLSAGRP